MAERPPPFQLWRQAQGEHPDDKDARGRRYVELMEQAGHIVKRELGDEGPLLACGYEPRRARRRRVEVDAAELDALIEENRELRAMLGRSGKDSGRMWYDRAQRLRRERDDALAEAERLRSLVADG